MMKGIQHQQSTYTKRHRYPKLFADCRAFLGDRSDLRLLSFGCSTGEEVASLGELWPLATIVGVDINPWCLEQCAGRHDSPRFTFMHRESDEFAAAADFDAVFCLAVFQRQENLTRGLETAGGHTFDQFEREVGVLDRKLNMGGLFAIDNADFLFTDTAVARRYEPLPSGNNCQLRQRPLYGPNNRKIADEYVAVRIFRKRAV
jgi:hypothetical protein